MNKQVIKLVMLMVAYSLLIEFGNAKFVPGFVGNLTNCRFAFCQSNEECKSGVSCINNRCASTSQVRCLNNGVFATNRFGIYFTPTPVVGLTYEQAKASCESLGIGLLSIKSIDELNSLRSVLRGFSIPNGSDFDRWIDNYNLRTGKWSNGVSFPSSLFTNSENATPACFRWAASDPFTRTPFEGVSQQICETTQPYICKFSLE